MHHERIARIVMGAVDEFNATFSSEHLAKSLDEPLYGRGGKLDSLGLVSFVVSVEQKIEEELGVSLTLADERAVSQRNSPFRTTGSLVDYVCMLLKEQTQDG